MDTPGHFLRHAGYRVSLVRNDGSAQFAADASFVQVAGLAHSRLTSLRAHNFPDRHLRHYSFGLRLDVIATDIDRADATFRMVD